MEGRRPTSHDEEVFIWAHLQFGPKKCVSHLELRRRYEAWLYAKQVLVSGDKLLAMPDLSRLHSHILVRGGGKVLKNVRAESTYRDKDQKVSPKEHFVGVTVIHQTGRIKDNEFQKLLSNVA